MITNQTIETKIQQLKNEEIVVNHGESILISSYIRTQQQMKSDFIVLTKNLWVHEYREFLQALKDNEVTEFILKDTSTGLMSTLQFLLENGATIAGTKTYQDNTSYFQEEHEKGLLIKL